MTWKKVIGYELELQLFPGDSDSGHGNVTLNFEEGDTATITKLADCLSAIVSVLRHDEKTIWFEDKHRILKTGAERPADLIATKTVLPKIPKELVKAKDHDLERVLK